MFFSIVSAKLGKLWGCSLKMGSTNCRLETKKSDSFTFTIRRSKKVHDRSMLFCFFFLLRLAFTKDAFLMAVKFAQRLEVTGFTAFGVQIFPRWFLHLERRSPHNLLLPHWRRDFSFDSSYFTVPAPYCAVFVL